jgi:hypothetical protein
MKKVLVFIFCFIPFLTFSQARVNREKISFISKSEILIDATGWSYNSQLGEWIDYKNVISKDKDYKERFKALQGSYLMSHCDQNFISLQTATITVDSILYYVLIVWKWYGRYEYPAIMEDWEKYKKVEGYVFSEDEYQNLYNIANNDSIVQLITKKQVEISLSYDTYNETKFLDLLQTEIKNKSLYGDYVFKVMKSEEGMIRFYIPIHSIYSEKDKYNFKDEYFETSNQKFSKIIIK